MTFGQLAGRALDGFRVLDFSAMIAGPYCTRWLADLGADVIKVEPPEGDMIRSTAPQRDGRSTYFGHLNAGKRGIVLDLKQPAAMQSALQLAAQADVLVENFRPGVMRRLGLDYDTLRAINPRLVYCSISGYGQAGPKSDRPSYAPIVQAASGWEMAHFAYQDDLDCPANNGLFAADVLASCYATMAIQAALLQRSRTNEGQHLDVTLMESILSVMIYEFQNAQFPSDKRKNLYLPMKTLDGFVIIAPISQKNFENLCEAMGRPQLKADPRLVNPLARRENWTYLMDMIREWTARHTGEFCETTMLAAGVPCSRYAAIEDVLADPHFQQRGSFAPVRDGTGGFLVQNLPFLMSGGRVDTTGKVPDLGEHTAEVLARLAAGNGFAR